jgi:hypothetical protein
MIEHAIVPDESGPCILIPSQFCKIFFWWLWQYGYIVLLQWTPRSRQEQQYSEHLSHAHMPCPSLSLGWNLDGLAKLAAQSTLQHQFNVFWRNEFEPSLLKKWTWTLFTDGYATEDSRVLKRGRTRVTTVHAWCVPLLLTLPIASDGHNPISCWTVTPFALSRLVFLASALPCQSGIFQNSAGKYSFVDDHFMSNFLMYVTFKMFSLET